MLGALVPVADLASRGAAAAEVGHIAVEAGLAAEQLERTALAVVGVDG